MLGHVAILSALGDFGPLSQQELADSLDFDKSHLVGRLDVLVNRGLVTRTQDPPTGAATRSRSPPPARRSRTSCDLRRVLEANDVARRR